MTDRVTAWEEMTLVEWYPVIIRHESCEGLQTLVQESWLMTSFFFLFRSRKASLTEWRCRHTAASQSSWCTSLATHHTNKTHTQTHNIQQHEETISIRENHCIPPQFLPLFKSSGEMVPDSLPSSSDNFLLPHSLFLIDDEQMITRLPTLRVSLSLYPLPDRRLLSSWDHFLSFQHKQSGRKCTIFPSSFPLPHGWCTGASSVPTSLLLNHTVNHTPQPPDKSSIHVNNRH